MEERKKYMWRLMWSGRKPVPSMDFIVKFLDTFPLWRDSKAHLVTHEELMQLVADGKIAPPTNYWTIDEGEQGLIALERYAQYSQTWDRITTAKGDLEAGWDACEAGYEYLRKWDEAIAINKAMKDAKKSKLRTFTGLIDYYVWNDFDQSRFSAFGILKCEQRYMGDEYKVKFTFKCTVEELDRYVYELERYLHCHFKRD